MSVNPVTKMVIWGCVLLLSAWRLSSNNDSIQKHIRAILRSNEQLSFLYALLSNRRKETEK